MSDLIEAFRGDLQLTKTELESMIVSFEASLAKHEQLEIPIVHHFSKDVYAREMRVPSGSIIVGKIHRYENLNILSGGEVSVLSIDGVRRVKAPYTFVASPGAKRVFYVHEDATWTVIHGTAEKDVDKIEDEFIAKSYKDLYLNTDRTLNQVLLTLGYTAEELRQISETTEDLIPYPDSFPVEVKASPIEGLGLFAKAAFQPGDVIAPARIEGKRTPAGRYTNHSGKPNAEMVQNTDGNVNLKAVLFIKEGEEITVDYYFSYVNTRG